MHELLERLHPSFEKAFKDKVSINELTYFSLQLNGKSALVITNRYLYLIRKGLLSVKCLQYTLEEVEQLQIKDKKFLIFMKNNSAITLESLDSRKLSILALLVKQYQDIRSSKTRQEI
ncbi:MAG: hypothetical protein AB1420_12065 [Bacillota bacterium]